jgi:NodT family efflux transporter outer membrane factor (OMF) lipoprotein
LAPGLLALYVLLAGCATRPPYQRPIVPVPDAFSAGHASRPANEADWWTGFGDSELTSLVARSLAANLDVQQAAARVREAREQEKVTRGGQGPQVNASAQASDATLSKNALPSALTGLFGGNPAQASSGSGIGLPGETFQTYQAGFDASWELDLFGGQRSANDAAHARTEAAKWSARDARVTLAAEVAATYQQLRVLQRRVALSDQIVADDRETLDYLQVRARNGLIPDSDAIRQQRELAQAIAQHQDLAAQADARIHAMGTLLAAAPNALTAELAAPAPSAPNLPQVPAGLPSELLQRRPDIRAAERQVAAATADVGVATADLYPKITLTGGLQLASRSLSTLLQSDSLQDNASGRISLPLIGRDRLKATVSLRKAQADDAVIGYRKAVFVALRDVEDALTRLAADRARLDQLRAAATTAEDELQSADVRYRNGLSLASDRLAARQTWSMAQDTQAQAEAAAAQDMVALYKALGGGWDERRALAQEDK